MFPAHFFFFSHLLPPLRQNGREVSIFFSFHFRRIFFRLLKISQSIYSFFVNALLQCEQILQCNVPKQNEKCLRFGESLFHILFFNLIKCIASVLLQFFRSLPCVCALCAWLDPVSHFVEFPGNNQNDFENKLNFTVSQFAQSSTSMAAWLSRLHICTCTGTSVDANVAWHAMTVYATSPSILPSATDH